MPEHGWDLDVLRTRGNESRQRLLRRPSLGALRRKHVIERLLAPIRG